MLKGTINNCHSLSQGRHHCLRNRALDLSLGFPSPKVATQGTAREP